MALTVEVSEELEAKIEQAAKRRGVSPDEFVRTVLEEKLSRQPAQPRFPARIIDADLPVRDRSREYEWLEKHRDEYDGQYVALDGDKLVAAGFDAKEVARKAREYEGRALYLGFVEGRNRPRFMSGGFWRE